MSEIISKDELPSPKWYSRIQSDKLDEIFAKAKKYPDSLVDLLLNNESTAVYHLDPTNTYCLGDKSNPVFIRPVLLGVNYHEGHSEGAYKIVVQNIPKRKGPWVLFKPPGSREDTFYLQNMILPEIWKPEFREEVDNVLKISKRYLHKGDPLDIFLQFQEAGFKFVDKPMSREYMEKVVY